MIDPAALHVWSHRVYFVLVCLALIFIRLLPIDIGFFGLPGPDLMLCVTAAWIIRRPDFVPPILIALLFLTADLLFQRPPGLHSALVLITAEFLRRRVQRYGDMTFAVEWLLVSGAFLALTVAERVALAVSFTPKPGLGPMLLVALLTVLAYPLVVLFSNMVFRVRKAAPREAGILGHRL
ncbi:rod shape-determining protein MreD [Maritimibacter sp. 55A14]|uniref:rod shape-determining protein MreD n=1 Tax=Maritimibacter sp. 55A14 TaxID=2174844 RepID=UPI000D61B470|nr:rod shape-determining protein MreD [Maritimibacter sp. 55A14]PWE32123.1 rod shape-determining protein MreD [Maritimibacter sp. 55A14]